MEGRIHFPGNPWPEGHALETLEWSGRVDAERGLVFDLHLRSAKYYAEREFDDDEEGDDAFDSPGVWSNYHACTLSSTKWASQGWVVGTWEEPFTFASLAGRQFVVDSLDSPEFDVSDVNVRAFHIYLMGHDGVADHRIQFTRQDRDWNLDWRGRIVLAYIGREEFEYEFQARATGLEFAGFQVDETLSDDEAKRHFARTCAEAAEFTLAKRHGKSWFVRSP